MTGNAFIERYISSMKEVMVKMNPDVDDNEIENIIRDTVEKKIQNPTVILDNNYTHETRETNLLSVLNWVETRKPIICGNGTFYKNQDEAINPTAVMLDDFAIKRSDFKKQMFAVENPNSHTYKDFDRKQNNEKINMNSYYGASGLPSSPFYSKYSGPATTHTAQEIISSAEMLFEGLLGDNYIYLNTTECIDWLKTVTSDFEEEYCDDFIKPHSLTEVANRLFDAILEPDEDSYETLCDFLCSYSEEELARIYYKNNIFDFIADHEEIKSIFVSIFDNVINLDYVNKNDDNWINEIPAEYYDNFVDKSAGDWNKYVNREFFMDPSKPPESISMELFKLNQYIMKYVYCRYLSIDRIYRHRNFKRKVVTVIDTDSNILSIDTLVHHIFSFIDINGYGRSSRNNEFICINTMAYIISHAIENLLLYFGEMSNIPEEYRSRFVMKNEFYFSILIIGNAKKRYITKIILREGNLLNPPKYDIKGFDFKKSTTSEYCEEVFMGLVKKYLIDNEGDFDIKSMLKDVFEFRNDILLSIKRGEINYLPTASVKEMASYANPFSEASVRGVSAWNILHPDRKIEIPSRVSMLKLNIFKPENIANLVQSNPHEYRVIMKEIFEDNTGMFVQKTSKGVTKVVGMNVIAIPQNATIPEWLTPYIDYTTIVNNILSPFVPVLELFGIKTLDEGKSTTTGINRRSNSISNIIKF